MRKATPALEEGALTPLLVDLVYKRRVAEVVLDLIIASACYYGAYRLRFEDPEDFMKNFGNFTSSFPLVVGVQMVAFFAVGVYRGVWRHFGMNDALVITRGIFFGAVTSQLFILYVYRFFSYSRTVFAIYAVLLLISMTLARASLRLAGEFIQRQRQSGRRVAIYGADDGGTLALSQLARRADEFLRVLGFVDDDPRRAGARIGGYPVLGNFSALELLIDDPLGRPGRDCQPADDARAHPQSSDAVPRQCRQSDPPQRRLRRDRFRRSGQPQRARHGRSVPARLAALSCPLPSQLKHTSTRPGLEDPAGGRQVLRSAAELYLERNAMNNQPRTYWTLKARRYADIAIVIACLVVGALVGSRHYRDVHAAGGKPWFYQVDFGPAVMWTCGHGFVLPDVAATGALGRFLRQEVDQFSCDELPSKPALRPIVGSQPWLTWSHLLRSAAVIWSFTGIAWSRLAPLAGVFFGTTVAIAYVLLRLVSGRVLATAGAAFVLTSPLFMCKSRNSGILRKYRSCSASLG